MGTQLSFTEENIKKNPFDYPKLKLAKGENARLTIVEDPYSEYVHSIQKPQLDERGNVLYRTAERKDGTEYQVPKLTWVSSPICLGERDVLDENGIDPDNCPVCARAAAGEKGFYPKRRFAMHVIRTNTRPKTFDAVDPYSGQLIIWAFTDTIFNKLFGFQKEFGLKDHDLKLGPCTDENFQKAELNVANDTAVEPKMRKAIFDEKNRAEDPSVFCGMRKTKARIEEDLAQVDAQWALAKGEDPDEEGFPTAASLNEGIGALLSEDEPEEEAPKKAKAKTKAKAKEETKVEPAVSFDDLPDLLGDDSEGDEEEAPKTEKSDGAISLDDLLDNL